MTLTGQDWSCITGLIRPAAAPDGEDAFAVLTTEPGPDLVPTHSRQVVVVGRADWARWLGGPDPEALLRLSQWGALTVERLA